MAIRVTFGILAGFFQIAFLILFVIFAEYGESADGSLPKNSIRGPNGTDPAKNSLLHFYPMFQDIHVMMFIGFGFLMTFLRLYGFSAIGFNMMISAFCIQWSILVGGFLSFIHGHDSHFTINIESMINGDFAAATVLITFGAVLGKTSPAQLLIVAFIEIVVFKVNEYIGLDIFKATDTGGSMYVHAFGAYFGLALARVLYTDKIEESKNEGSSYNSDLFAMIGSIFLWMYWPSFNAALVTGDRQHRAVINTYLTLVSCVITTFMVQNFICKKNKFDMVHVQNATLAGGVAVGTCADMMLQPSGAIGVGMVSAILSSIGYEYVTPLLSRVKVHDTCGVNNLHGMPGVMAGIIGIIMASVASISNYHESLYLIYPGRAPLEGSEALHDIQKLLPDVEAGDARTAGAQAGYQAAALGVTLVVALVSGAITGLILKCRCLDQPDVLFVDSEWWGTPDDFPASPEGELIPDATSKQGYGSMIDQQPNNGVNVERRRPDSITKF